MRVELADEARPEFGECNARGCHEQVLQRRSGLDDLRQRAAGSAIASYMLCVMVPWSRNEMLLLACGSRSMRSVFRPRIAKTAARFTAVVVLPTPPF